MIVIVQLITARMLTAELLEHLQRGFLQVLHFNAACTRVPIAVEPH